MGAQHLYFKKGLSYHSKWYNVGGTYRPNKVLIKNDACIIRDLRLVAYFRQCLPRELDISTYKELADFLASITPYEVPLSRIKVKHLHQQVPSSEANHSLNATIVGLARHRLLATAKNGPRVPTVRNDDV
ncbi:hypothetical protein C4D60_Mb01t00060 [Musa balbisiana]|uniref:NOL9 C-terminal domain-containing protein n=1 Tax=Musa balbisiana TaxID=52838 RepID=A0A4S8JJI1_MUSBA|nr:hypothetical protein C4D60_Mb01t00060 [Musa balbisiana]